MHPSDYTKLLTENVTKSYKHAQEHIATNIAEEFKDIVEELKLTNRTDTMAESTAFLTLKDHKPDFENHTKCRLINPAKSDVGKISKSILDTVNSKIREQTGVNQWRNSSDTIAWFQSIPLKNRKSFISFDIVDFYPSITESLLDQSIDWATQFTAITDSDIRIIKHARKSLLFHDGLPWVKRDSSNAFDVTMGSFDGAEICELVGLFILSKLKDTFGNNIGLYRDDGLVLLDTKSGRLSDKARKDLTHAFNELGLNITAQANQLSTNFLDITFDLSNGTYKPYRKPNDEPLYINRHSNHPPPIIQELLIFVNKRINSSKHVWNLKKENRQFSIRWAIVKQLPAGRNGKRNCTLCLEEKLMIMKGRSKNILNRRSEMFSKCRHVI